MANGSSSGGGGIPVAQGQQTPSLLSGLTHQLVAQPVTVCDLHFQRSPGNRSGNDRGIDGLDFEVLVNNRVVQRGTSGPDGLIAARFRGTEAVLHLLVQGNVVARYQVKMRTQTIEAATTVRGHQRRLRMLGYHIGHAGPEQDGVDGSMGRRTDRSILEFQADEGVTFDGVVGGGTRGRLTTAAGA